MNIDNNLVKLFIKPKDYRKRPDSFKVWLVKIVLSIVGTIGVFSPVLSMVFVNSPAVFSAAVLLLSTMVYFSLKRLGIVFWVLTVIFLAGLWFVPSAFAFSVHPFLIILAAVMALSVGFFLRQRYSWKWGLIAGVFLYCSCVGFSLFALYQLTFPWQFNQVLEKGKPVVRLIFDERNFPEQNMVRNLSLDIRRNLIFATRGPDLDNYGSALIIGDLNTGNWTFHGSDSSQALAADPLSGEVFVGEARQHRVEQYDYLRKKTVTDVSLNKPVNCRLHVKTDNLYCIHENPHRLRLLRTKGLIVVRETKLRHVQGLYALYTDPEEKYAYLGCTYRFSGRIVKYKLPELIPEQVSDIGWSYVWGITGDPTGRLLYAALPFAGKVAVVDADSLHRVGEIDLEMGVRDLLVEDNVLYVGNFVNGKIIAVDLGTGQKIWEVYGGPRVRGLARNPQTKIFYAATALGIIAIDETYAAYAYQNQNLGG